MAISNKRVALIASTAFLTSCASVLDVQYPDTPEFETENFSQISRYPDYRALVAALNRADYFQDYLAEEAIANAQTAGIWEAIEILATAGLIGTLIASGDITALRIAGGANIGAQLLGQLHPGDLLTTLIMRAEDQVKCAAAIARPFRISLSAYVKLFYNESGDINSTIYDGGQRKRVQESLDEVERLRALLETRRRALATLGGDEPPGGKKEIDNAVSAANAALDVLAQLDLYEARLASVTVGLDQYLNTLNRSLKKQSNALRATPQDIARAIVEAGKRYTALKTEIEESAAATAAAAGAETPQKKAATPGVTEAVSGNRTAFVREFNKTIESLSQTTATLKSRTSRARLTLNSHIGPIKFEDPNADASGNVTPTAPGQLFVANCELPNTNDFLSVDREGREELKAGKSVTYEMQVGLGAQPSVEKGDGAIEKITIGEVKEKSTGSRRFTVTITAAADIEEKAEVSVKFSSSGANTVITRDITLVPPADADPPDNGDEENEQDETATDAISGGASVNYEDVPEFIRAVQIYLNRLRAGEASLGLPYLKENGVLNDETRRAIAIYKRTKPSLINKSGILDTAAVAAFGEDMTHDVDTLTLGRAGEEKLSRRQKTAVEKKLLNRYRNVHRGGIRENGDISEMERRFLFDWRVLHATRNPGDRQIRLLGPIDQPTYENLTGKSWSAR